MPGSAVLSGKCTRALFIIIALVGLGTYGVAMGIGSSDAHPVHSLPPEPFADNRVLVKFIPGTAAASVRDAHGAANGTVLSTLSGIDVQVIAVPGGSVAASLAMYRNNPNVLFAEPDFHRVFVVPNEGQDPASPGIDYFDEQWGLHNTGQFLIDPSTGTQTLYGSPDADIDAPEGWDIHQGLSSTVIAILDSGLDRAVACDGTTPAVPNLEFDGKCVDAQNFVTDFSSTTVDLVNHGTHVAGIAAARTDNGIGIAGVGWHSSLANLKTCYAYIYDACYPFGCSVVLGVCPVSSSSAALTYAADQGYPVVNMSYGSDVVDPATGDPLELAGYNETEAAAVSYAWERGVVMVAAAGNSGNTTRSYPAAYDQVIAVGATERNDDRASFSTFGDWVSVLAPGENILSTVPNEVCEFYSDILGIPFDPTSDVCLDWYSGTSMASPHVAGAAAMIWSQLFPGADPAGCRDAAGIPCNQAVRDRIERGADLVGANGQNFLAWSAHGRLNLAGALTAVAEPPGDGPSAAFQYNCSANQCDFDGSASTGEGLAYAWDFGDNNSGTGIWVSHTFASQGRYTVTLTVTETDNDSASVSATFRVKNRGVTSGSADGGSGGDSGTGTLEAEKGRKKCSDGRDNDGDGLVDGADPDCR